MFTPALTLSAPTDAWRGAFAATVRALVANLLQDGDPTDVRVTTLDGDVVTGALMRRRELSRKV